MKKIIFILFLTGLFYSCKKENVENIVFPLTLELKEVTDVSNVRLFTNGKEVIEPNSINTFTADESWFKAGISELYLKSKLYIESTDSIRFDNEVHKFSIEKNNNQYLFISSKSIYDYPFLYSMQKYQYKNPELFGTETIFLNKPVRVGYGTYSNLKISYFLCKFSMNSKYLGNGETGKNVHFFGIIINEFNEDFIKSLSATDTLAIKEFKVNYVKK